MDKTIFYMNFGKSGGTKVAEIFRDKETAIRQSDVSEDCTAIPIEIVVKNDI